MAPGAHWCRGSACMLESEFERAAGKSWRNCAGIWPVRRWPTSVFQNCRMRPLSYRMKTPWRNGTTHVLFDPLEFLEKLAVLVPAPRANLIHYFGVLAPAAKWRSVIVPQPPAGEDNAQCRHENNGDSSPRRRNYTWASLMARVFEIDVLQCSSCKERLRILTAIHPPVATRKILECLGLPTRAPPLRPAVSSQIPDFS